VDWERFRSMSDAEIERAVPRAYRNLPDDFWDNANVVWPVGKEAISIRIDQDVLEWFRRSGPRYQSRINAVLRSYMTRSQKQGTVRPPVRRRHPTD
jgi:uncharacterized protein (DUF4415 family)